jgi:nicotinamide-nucleotide amidase
MEPTLYTIRQCLGELIFGTEDDELQHAVVRLLSQRKQTLATLECGTGGLVAHWLSEVSGSEGVYRGGQVVSREAFGEVTPDRIARWANQARSQLGADYALLIGPFPEANSEGKVQLAVATEDKVIPIAIAFTGHPDILKARTGKSGLNLLRLTLS